jgi:hypothetical protein
VRQRYNIICVVAAFFLALSGLTSQPREVITKNSEGKEFWLCFMKNFRSTNNRQDRQAVLQLQLFLTSNYDAKVKIEIEEIGYENEIDIGANTVVNIQIPARAQLRATETAERLAVHITSDTAISVYGLNSRFQTTDTFLGLPVQVIGTEYRVVGYTKLAADLLSAFSIVATEDNTEIDITPTATTSTGRGAGLPFRVRLRKGDVYTVSARWQSIGPCDLTGSHIKSNKKIAVFSGHNCAYVPPKIDACNHLVEQLPPVSSWGKHYYLGMLKERSRYTYRVIAAEQNTRVFSNSKLVAVLNAGEFYEELNVFEHVQITADKPVLVAQFAQGFKNGDSVGDPMMILISPTQQFMDKYRFATPINGEWHHYVNVVAPTESIRQIRLNGRMIDSTMFSVLGQSRYSIAQVPIPFGTHVIRSETPFGLYSYGFGYGRDAYDAYGNMAGQSFFELNQLIDTLAPTAEPRANRQTLDVVFRDDRVADAGLASITVERSAALDVEIPKIEKGTPQATVSIIPAISGSGGQVVLRATDVAGNVSFWTVCYVFDSRTERYVFLFEQGSTKECVVETAWMVGAFTGPMHSFHTADFSSSGNVKGQSSFGETEGLGWTLGGLIGRRLSVDMILNARLSLTTVGGTFSSPDSTISSVYDSASGKPIPYQEGTTLALNAPYMRVGAAIQWFPLRYFYLMGGAQLAIPIGDNISVTRTILRPPSYVFSNGTNERDEGTTSMGSLSPIGLELVGGLGFSYPLTFKTSILLETQYVQRLNSMIEDGSWRLGTLGLSVGILWRL